MESMARLASLSTFMICWRTFSAAAPDLASANCWRSFSASSLAWATCWARFSASLGPQPVDRSTTNRLTSSKTIRFINVLLFAPFRDFASYNSNNRNPKRHWRVLQHSESSPPIPHFTAIHPRIPQIAALVKVGQASGASIRAQLGLATIGFSPPQPNYGNSVTGHEIRQRFLDFFSERGHTKVRSSSLVPANDPTLLFTNAGMNQFKEVFTGVEKRAYSRAASSQKCVRAGGKHNDLENVGYTRRHHTFFEMLGNFSFGDYFKAEAIEFAWDLITKDYGLPKDKLYVTVFREDDEAEELWQKVTGIPKSRIFRLDEKDNFWQMGETGPCGPCSEIHYDLGVEAADPGREGEAFPSDAGGRFVEIWNLVFMQFDRDAAGKLTPLPRPSIDTGMGLERIAAVLQGKISNYDTDLIRPIILAAADLCGLAAGADARVDTALRIAADHARAAAFLVHDGVLPANDGRGYVLRKIMRRAMRNIRMVGMEEPFLYKLTGFVAELMQGPYPEMIESVQRVARVVKDEEHRYATTFLTAEKEFNHAAAVATDHTIAGAVSFKLYDTFGLALDEQEDMARESGLTIDREGFEREMKQQRERARASWKGAEKGAVTPAYQKLLEQGRTKFLGYTELEASSRVIGLLVEKELVDEVAAGAHAEVVFDQTPFYAESGGQVGDRGALYSAQGEKVADVESAFPGVPGLTVHRIVTAAALRVGDVLRGEVAAPLRDATRRNHTATHLDRKSVV